MCVCTYVESINEYMMQKSLVYSRVVTVSQCGQGEADDAGARGED
jgi:hypothetical protein